MVTEGGEGMDRKAIAKATAQETLDILEQGYYQYEGKRVEIEPAHRTSVERSILIRPEEELTCAGYGSGMPKVTVDSRSTVDVILSLREQGVCCPGVLNFASAKNPGGGFLNGAMAQEESLAASSGLYPTQCAHPEYYEVNRTCGTIYYTNYAIYSPGVVVFRDGGFRLLPEPVYANLLTLPAVNFGQAVLKGEDPSQAKAAMKNRMCRALEVFAHRGDRTLILGAYGCGVFRNDPAHVARWWRELLAEGYGGCFERIVHAVYDRSQNQTCLSEFRAGMKG